MKSRQSRSQRVTVKQGINLQYAVAAGCALAAVVGVAVFAYLNLGNSEESFAANARFYAVQPGYWSSTQTWEGAVGPPSAEIKHDVEVLNRVVRRGPLSYKKGTKRTLTVVDTLIVEGNLTLGHKANLDVRAGGVLMVGGDLVVNKKSEITNYGTIAVGGNYTIHSLGKITYLGDSNQLFCFGKVVARDEPASFGQDGPALRRAQPTVYAQIKRAKDVIQPILFTARLRQGAVVTEWMAPGETAHFDFAVERSANGMLFDELMTTGKEVTSLLPNQRSYIDPSPVAGASYYRLKRTDPAGHFVYSQLVMVVNNENNISLNDPTK